MHTQKYTQTHTHKHVGLIIFRLYINLKLFSIAISTNNRNLTVNYVHYLVIHYNSYACSKLL